MTLLSVAGSLYLATANVAIYSVTGQLINTYPLKGKETIVPLSGFTSGLYFCVIISGGKKMEVKKLVVIR